MKVLIAFKKKRHGNRIFGKNSWKLIIPRSHLLTLLLPAILCTWVMLSSRWFRGLLGIYLPWWGCIVDPIGEEYSLFCLVFGTSVGRECYRCFHYLHVPTFPTRPYQGTLPVNRAISEEGRIRRTSAPSHTSSRIPSFRSICCINNSFILSLATMLTVLLCNFWHSPRGLQPRGGDGGLSSLGLPAL